MVGEHNLQCAADPLRRPSAPGHIEDDVIQLGAFDQFASETTTGLSREPNQDN